MVAVVLILVVGPKDLPPMLRSFGRTVKKYRGMANDFKGQFNDALEESELDELRQTVTDAKSYNPLSEVTDAVKDAGAGINEAIGDVKPWKPKPEEISDVARSVGKKEVAAKAAAARKTLAKKTTAPRKTTAAAKKPTAAAKKTVSTKAAAPNKPAAKTATAKTTTAKSPAVAKKPAAKPVVKTGAKAAASKSTTAAKTTRKPRAAAAKKTTTSTGKAEAK